MYFGFLGNKCDTTSWGCLAHDIGIFIGTSRVSGVKFSCFQDRIMNGCILYSDMKRRELLGETMQPFHEVRNIL